MGLDISIYSDNYEEIAELEEFEKLEDNFKLSREFCNLMCRKNVIESGIPELEQIGSITGCGITFLYDMENYTPEWELEDLIEYEDEETIETYKKENLAIEGSLDTVIHDLEKLLNKLNEIQNHEQKIQKTDYDTIGIEFYFSDFKINKGDGYIGNNFGQDLRNLLLFAQFVKEKGGKTIFFQYG